MEVFADLRGRPMQNVFDTQIAASFLGLGEQVGYAALVKTELQVELGKEHTRTDWSKRPLSSGQLRYAADDVRYLMRLYEILTARLSGLQRLSWVHEECRALSEPALYSKDTDLVWHRVKNWQVLPSRALAYLKLLSIWRETRAQMANCPRRWVLDDQSMLNFALAEPSQLERASSFFPDKFWQKHQSEIGAIIQQVQAMPASEWPQAPQRQSLSSAQLTRLKRIQKAIKEKAAAMNVSASMLARRADLESWVRGESPPNLRDGWRQQVLADILLDEAG